MLLVRRSKQAERNMPQRQRMANNRGGQSRNLPRTKPSKAIWLCNLFEMNRPDAQHVCTLCTTVVCTDCTVQVPYTSRIFHLVTATISISDTPCGHTTSIITFPFATSPTLTSRFSMLSTCRRIGCKNTAVCLNAGKVRDQC